MLISPGAAIWLPLVAFCISCAGTFWLAHDLARKGKFDYPVERSSHEKPTPRGGGLAIFAAFAPLAALLGFDPIILLALGFLAALSLVDDWKRLSWQGRLAAHCLAVGVALASLWQDGALQQLYMSFAAVPLVLFVAAVGFAWIWHINLFNFMDGSDGLAGSQALFIALAASLFLFTTDAPESGLHGLLLAASVAGFLVWNYPPARIFMGEVGSIPLGFLTGYFLIKLAAAGGVGIAIALPLWFWADATVTLLIRLWRGERIASAHRDHLYQQAAGKTKAGHARVLYAFIALQLFLLVLSVLFLSKEPERQWVLPLVSLALGGIFFWRLSVLAEKNKV